MLCGGVAERPLVSDGGSRSWMVSGGGGAFAFWMRAKDGLYCKWLTRSASALTPGTPRTGTMVAPTKLGACRSFASGPAPPPSPTSPSPSYARTRRAAFAAGLGLFGAATYFFGVFYPPEIVELAFARPAPPPAQVGSPEALEQAARIEKEMAELPQLKKLLASASHVAAPPPSKAPSLRGDDVGPVAESPATTVSAPEDDASGERPHYALSRPFARFPAQMMPHSLTASSLRKPGMLAVPPMVLSKTRHGATVLGGHQGDAYAFIHLGRSLCGHDGIVHGGLLATVLDETLARTSFYHLPHNIGVTARLEVDYKYPVKADQVVVVETRLASAQGRKAHVEGDIRDLSGRLLVQSKALFVEPRHIEWLDTSAVRHVMDRNDA